MGSEMCIRDRGYATDPETVLAFKQRLLESGKFVENGVYLDERAVNKVDISALDNADVSSGSQRGGVFGGGHPAPGNYPGRGQRILCGSRAGGRKLGAHRRHGKALQPSGKPGGLTAEGIRYGGSKLQTSLLFYLNAGY